MKKYLLFFGDIYYPLGGWKDFLDCFDTDTEALDIANIKLEKNGWGCWYHIVDSDTSEIIHNRIKLD